MKKSVLALCCVTVAAGIAAAQSAPSMKIGILQAEAALASTKEGQAALAELDKKLGPKKADLEKKQNEIKELQDKFQRGANTASQATKDQLQREIDDKTRRFNRDVQDYQDEGEGEQNKLLADLTTKMRAVIDKYGKDNGYSLILNVSNPNTPVLYFADTVDITKAIIEAYDKAQPAAAPGRPAITPVKPPAAKPPTSVTPPTAAPPKKQP